MGICLPLFFFIIISDCLEQLMRIVGKRGGMPALFLSFPSIPVAIHALSNVLLYREEWINMLIVIDHGNKNIKTKHRTFTAGLLASEYPAYGGLTKHAACDRMSVGRRGLGKRRSTVTMRSGTRRARRRTATRSGTAENTTMRKRD